MCRCSCTTGPVKGSAIAQKRTKGTRKMISLQSPQSSSLLYLFFGLYASFALLVFLAPMLQRSTPHSYSSKTVTQPRRASAISLRDSIILIHTSILKVTLHQYFNNLHVYAALLQYSLRAATSKLKKTSCAGLYPGSLTLPLSGVNQIRLGLKLTQ